MFEYKNIKITKYSQSGFRIDWQGQNLSNIPSKQVIYIDPFKVPNNEPTADIIFISHQHYDHLDIDSLKKITTSSTIILGNKLVKDALVNEDYIENFEILTPGFQKGINESLIYMAISAYNTNKFNDEKRLFHPKEQEGLGFILEFNMNTKNEIRIYFMGDTDFVKEEMTPVNIDILMIPISGKYVMTKEEAVNAIESIEPKIAIPMHYDSGTGSLEDAKFLKDNTKTKIEII